MKMHMFTLDVHSLTGLGNQVQGYYGENAFLRYLRNKGWKVDVHSIKDIEAGTAHLVTHYPCMIVDSKTHLKNLKSHRIIRPIQIGYFSEDLLFMGDPDFRHNDYVYGKIPRNIRKYKTSRDTYISPVDFFGDNTSMDKLAENLEQLMVDTRALPRMQEIIGKPYNDLIALL